MGSCFPPEAHSPRQHPAQACPEGTFFDRPNRPWPQTSRSVSPSHTLRRMNLPSPSHAAAPLTARHAVDSRHVHEQTDKPVPRPRHVRKGHSSLAEGSPRSGYSGDRSPPAPQPSRGWLPPATIRNPPLFLRSLGLRPCATLRNRTAVFRCGPRPRPHRAAHAAASKAFHSLKVSFPLH